MPPLLPLSQVADIQAGLPTLPDGGAPIPILTVKALGESGRLEGPPDLLVPSLSTRPCYLLAPADILVAARSTALRSAITENEHEGIPFNATLLRIRCQPDRLDPEYLLAWLSHPLGKEAVSAMSRSSTHQMSLTASALEHLLVPVPPIAEQRRLAEFLSDARQAHDSALSAASARLALAREIAFRSLS